MGKNSNTSQALWDALQAHQIEIADIQLTDLYAQEPDRITRYWCECQGLYIDYARNYITQHTLSLLLQWAESRDLPDKIHAMFKGDRVNYSEARAAWHIALRRPIDAPDAIAEICAELQRLGDFVNAMHRREILGTMGKPINNIVNIGIGGSDVGPRLVCDALADRCCLPQAVRFVSNVDALDLNTACHNLDANASLFIISSKSFTTDETLLNAARARQWLLAHDCLPADHMLAVTANQSAALEFGIRSDRCFQIWDTVGGRYSLWSAMGLPVMLSIGMPEFMALLRGAHAMDKHFATTQLEQNVPVLMALLDIWYSNFFAIGSRAVFPYTQQLRYMPEYLAQLFMESNGKQIGNDEMPLTCHTAPVIWGGVGTNAQHTYFQFLHQGSRWVPVEFIAPLQASTGEVESHRKLLTNCLAQAHALMVGSRDTKGAQYIPGNKPSSSIFYTDLSPHTLGALLALYEHRAVAQGMLWGVNPFDQWGVELGKQLHKTLQAAFANDVDYKLDPASARILALYRQQAI